MPLISRTDLSEFAGWQLSTANTAIDLLESQSEFTSERSFDVFLSHSYADIAHPRGLSKQDLWDVRQLLHAFGFSVYVDWIIDRELNRNNVTAELGYFDGKKGRVAVLPLLDRRTLGNDYKGQEYLGIYPYIVRERSATGVDQLWVHENRHRYTSLTRWLQGTNPYNHQPK